jgi:hypothetical protein
VPTDCKCAVPCTDVLTPPCSSLPPVIYTTDASLPKEYIPELKLAAESVGLDWGKFSLTNNSCAPHPPSKSLVTEVGAWGLGRGLRNWCETSLSARSQVAGLWWGRAKAESNPCLASVLVPAAPLQATTCSA